MWLALLLSPGAASHVLPHLQSRWRAPTHRCVGRVVASVAAGADVQLPPDDGECAALLDAQPSPALEPREIVKTMLHALHKSNFDRPRTRFGCEVVLRFLAPSNPASRATPQRFAEYLSQPWYAELLDWNEFRWEGDLVLLREGREAYLQVGVRSGRGDARWTSVRWILKSVPFYATSDQWMVEAVFVEEPDGDEQPPRLALAGDAVEAAAAAEPEAPPEVVLRVMRALRAVDTPTPLHGCEVAIRQCSPKNAASRLSPQAFLQYLREPWYAILTEWDEIEADEPEPVEDDPGTVSQDVLVRRSADASWTIVNWQLSRHSGVWLTDSLSITE